MPYSTNPDWADVTPIAQDDGPNPIVPISYSRFFIEVMGYFRAILKSNEISARALQLTHDVILQNAANYTAWIYRRRCLFELGSDLVAELQFCTEMAENSPKNYQLWHHRRELVDRLNDPGDELKITREILKKDAKNYHVWAHRQWVLRRFSIWNEELAYVNELLNEDIRNNSAWSHRWLSVCHGAPLPGQASETQPDGTSDNKTDAKEAKSSDTRAVEVAPPLDGWTPELIEREICFADTALGHDVTNDSPWRYLEGLMTLPCFGETERKRLEDICRRYRESDANCPHPASLLVELLPTSGKDEAVALCTELATSLDTVRATYWQFRAAQF
jgi:protein farnesyltransferase/geranylgeranyltransferase type-1 subunit alpha